VSLRIAIDASRTTVARVTGTEHYAIELIRALLALNQTHHITLYFRDTPAPELFPPHDYAVHKIIPFRRVWTHLRFAGALWQDRPDVTLVPAHTLPFAFPGKAVVTVHDLGYKHFPKAHPFKQRTYLDITTRYSASRATRIMADSQATADDLTRFYGTSARKIDIVYPGVEAPVVVNETSAVLEKYGLPERYFLFIGTLQPRKNIANIARAYAHYREQVETPADFVFAGGKGWLFDEAWTAGIEGVHLTGYIDAEDKGALMTGAIGLVFPTLFEGFGFPVIEAMHVGTPVITSTSSSLQELAGEAAICVDPNNIGAIASAMITLEIDLQQRETLIARGHQQTQKFTWSSAAEQTLYTLEQTAKY